MPIRAAAVPYRRTPRGVEFLLVRTRNRRAWTFPKGHLERRESPGEAAQREALEEAAASGAIDPTPLTRYRYPTWLGPNTSPGEVCVEAYLMEVDSVGQRAPAERETAWFTPEAAARKLTEGRRSAHAREHRRVIEEAVARILESAEPAEGSRSDRSEQ
jgi:8-oxo-dGTP pyrophosphatase MutT (NUDIX family)